MSSYANTHGDVMALDLDEIRRAILIDYEHDSDKYDERDIEDMQSDINHIRVFTDTNMTFEDNVQNAISALQWRKSSEYHDLRAEEIPREFYHGNIYSIGEADAFNIVYVNLKAYRKISNWSNLYDKFNVQVLKMLEANYLRTGKKYAILSNVCDCSLSNSDVSCTLLLVQLIFKYFIGMFECVYFVNTPLMIRPILSVVRKVMPTKYQSKLKSASGKELLEQLDAKVLPPALYGSNLRYVDFSTYCPKGVLSTDDIGLKYGISQGDIERFKKVYMVR
ncbi:Motile sperm domain-containing protein 2 [Halotydeus destructor]|nr:Motile sperm domain-containing protein 2 [Halotydeus destructor]